MSSPAFELPSKSFAFRELADRLLSERGSSEAVTQSFRIAGSTVSICYARPELATLFNQAIAHHASCESENPSLSIVVCDMASCPLPMAVLDRFRQVQAGNLVAPASPIYFAQDRKTQFSLQSSASLLVLDIYDRSGRAVVWINDAQQYVGAAKEALCYPYRTIFAWHALTQNRCLVHAAAIAQGDAGLLFVGKGGTGKSSCALAATLGGNEFIADDSVLIDCSEAPKISNIYRTGRVRPKDLQHFPRFPSTLALGALSDSETDAADEKLMFCLDSLGCTIRSDAVSLQGIVVPEIAAPGIPPSVREISPTEALLHLAPSSLLHIPGYGQELLRRLARVTGSVPCYKWIVGEDRSCVLELVNQTIQAR